MDQQYSSILLENAVNEFAKLPGIGRKTALRLVLHLLRQEEGEAEKFGNTIIKLCKEIKRCHICHNISDSDTCTICGDPSRDASTLCVVENVKEVMVVENTRQFHGLYHVLGGVISPMDGIGPADLEIESLVDRVASGGIKEVILALSATMEGDTTNFYIFRKLAPFDVNHHHRQRSIHRRRVGIHRRNHIGAFHSQPHVIQRKFQRIILYYFH